jgi:hypothetical protein
MGDIGELVVRECKSSEFSDCDVVFSGLDSDVAGEIGMWRLGQHQPRRMGLLGAREGKDVKG